MTRCPCAHNIAATVEESTPPDMAMAMVCVVIVASLLAIGLWLLGIPCSPLAVRAILLAYIPACWNHYEKAKNQKPMAKGEIKSQQRVVYTQATTRVNERPSPA